MKYRFAFVRAGVHLFILPFLFIAYIFYFVYRGIPMLLGRSFVKTQYWEMKVILVLVMILHLAINIGWCPVLISLLTNNWNFMGLLLLTFIAGGASCWCGGLCQGCGNSCAIWNLNKTFLQLFPPKPIPPNPYENDPDYQEALKELEKI